MEKIMTVQELCKTVGNNIKTLRTKNGITQNQLSERAGVSRHAVYIWESGRNTPNNLSLILLASFFGVEICELFYSEDIGK